MRYNEYDNEKFFEEYAKMPRSKDGLRSAGEWRQLKPLFPKLQEKQVLDLGCGYGWHCKFAAEQGASQISGKYMGLRCLQSGSELCREFR